MGTKSKRSLKTTTDDERSLVMNLKNKLAWGFSLVSIALLFTFILPLVDRSDENQKQQDLQSEIDALKRDNLALVKDNEHLNYIHSLAIEFSMNPTFVALVDNYSQEYLQNGGSEWRLLKTPEFTTYIMLSLIHAESKGNPVAIGDSGRARGLTQIWLSTARQYGQVTAQELLDPETNISFAFKHFHQLLKKYKGNLALTLYAWNRGPGKVDKLLSYGESPQNGYAKKIYQAALLNNRQAIH